VTQIDIAGPDGNAFSLIGCAKNFAKQLDMDGNAITKEMMAGDYDHLLDTFEKHFGSIVEIVGRD
tara:strand:+ start:336 stop:530 length:195 start_codon:yes stop_codon:yes gene_type:complete